MARAYWKLTVSFILCFIISVISLNENFLVILTIHFPETAKKKNMAIPSKKII